MKKTRKYKVNFRYPEIKDTDRTYAGTLGPILREDGDWRDFLPPDEEQRQNGVESSACYIEAQQAGIAVVQEERFNLPNQNYSARFNALLSDGGESGGDPIKGAKSIKYDGLVAEAMMSFQDVLSWKQYHSWQGVNKEEVIRLGKEWLKEWEPKFKIVFEREEPIETKYASLREALKRGPVMVSVHAWYQRNGMYYKPQGKRDTHLTLAVYMDKENKVYVRDTYTPYLKVIEPNTNFEFAMSWTLEKQATQQEISIVMKILQAILAWTNLLPKPAPSPSPVLPQPEPITAPHGSKLIEWATAIRDFEGRPGDLSYRNNNPGNLKKASGGFMKFATWEAGWQALLDYLTRAATGKHKAYKPDFSLLQFFQVYAPSTDKNQPNVYARYVANRIGVEISEKIKNLV